MQELPQHCEPIRPSRPGRLATFLLYGAVLTALGAGTFVYSGLDKTVDVSVDGHTRTVHTFARTVGAVLEHADVSAGVHDRVEPAAATRIADGTHIDVVHGRPLQLFLDGRNVVVWVTAGTVEDALAELGLTQRGLYVSASMSRPVPLSGLGLVVRMPHKVTVLHDGTTARLTTVAATVRDVLAQARVRLGSTDTVSVPLNAQPGEGMVIAVTRVHKASIVVTESIPYATRHVRDGDLYKGHTEVVQSGREGVRVKRVAVTRVNGVVHSRHVISARVVREPVTRMVHVGTKPRPRQSGDIGNEKVDSLNWYALAGCESGHDRRAYTASGPYYGLYQFTQGTWESVGGQGDPRDASSDEQTYRAKKLYLRTGDSSWPACGHYLYE